MGIAKHLLQRKVRTAHAQTGHEPSSPCSLVVKFGEFYRTRSKDKVQVYYVLQATTAEPQHKLSMISVTNKFRGLIINDYLLILYFVILFIANWLHVCSM